MAARVKYKLPPRLGRIATESISRWWMERWLHGRIEREDVLERMTRQTLVHPIRHGARVVLPADDSEQGRLFADR